MAGEAVTQAVQWLAFQIDTKIIHAFICTDSVKEDRLVGRVVKASVSRAEDPGFESRLRRDFFGVESYQ